VVCTGADCEVVCGDREGRGRFSCTDRVDHVRGMAGAMKSVVATTCGFRRDLWRCLGTFRAIGLWHFYRAAAGSSISGIAGLWLGGGLCQRQGALEKKKRSSLGGGGYRSLVGAVFLNGVLLTAIGVGEGASAEALRGTRGLEKEPTCFVSIWLRGSNRFGVPWVKLVHVGSRL